MLTLEVTGLPPGSYPVIIDLRDRYAQGATARFALPIEIVE